MGDEGVISGGTDASQATEGIVARTANDSGNQPGDSAENSMNTDDASATSQAAAPTLDPTPEEIEAWAERERKRREDWLQGPDEDERAAFARRVRQRRIARLYRDPGEIDAFELAREMARYPREAQLAVEGAMSLLWRWYRHRMADFVEAGREWEEGSAKPARRRRVRLDDDS